MYRRKKVSKNHHWITYLLIIIVIPVAIFIYKYQQYQYYINTPVNPQNTEEQVFVINKGENLKAIAKKLKEENLILNADSFSLFTKLNKLDTKIKTGRFPLSQSFNAEQILSTITSNTVRQVIVTIPEGSTIQNIDTILTNLDLINPGEFINTADNFELWDKYSYLNKEILSKRPHPLEGYLFPDTYYVSADHFTNEDFITQLLNNFQKKVLPQIKDSNKNLDQIINIAAMVEKEVNQDSDRPLVAGIIWKRLEENWPLGIDATLLYEKDNREITYQDLQTDTPYNTRLHTGLPLGPIANPGLASILGTITPQESQYYFYLTSKDGEMIYSTNNAEHNINKQKYL